MKSPDIIYLQTCGDCRNHELCPKECDECKFDELAKVTWSQDRIYDTDLVYFSEKKVREVLKYKLTKFQMDKVSIEGEDTNGKKIEMNGMVTFNLGNIDKVIDSILKELKGGRG